MNSMLVRTVNKLANYSQTARGAGSETFGNNVIVMFLLLVENFNHLLQFLYLIGFKRPFTFLNY